MPTNASQVEDLRTPVPLCRELHGSRKSLPHVRQRHPNKGCTELTHYKHFRPGFEGNNELTKKTGLTSIPPRARKACVASFPKAGMLWPARKMRAHPFRKHPPEPRMFPRSGLAMHTIVVPR